MKKLLLIISAFIFNSNAFAGIYDISYFNEPGKFSVGTEIDTAFKAQYGSFLNIKVKEGLTDLLNLEQTIGLGANDRKWRLGAKAILDVFPDTEDQPGFGVSFGTDFYKLEKGILTDLSSIAYAHKKFKAHGINSNVFLGYNFTVQLDSNTKSFATPMTIAAGVNFFPTKAEDLMITAELNIPITSSAYTTISGGLGYRF